MKVLGNIIGGLAGALALNILHQTVKDLDADAPRVDLVGEEALSKSLDAVGIEPPVGEDLFKATLTADVISNTLYYSLIGVGKNKNLVWRGLFYGLTAGIGAVTLPKPMGLNDAPVTRTDKTRAMTIGWYTFGGVVTAVIIRGLRSVSFEDK